MRLPGAALRLRAMSAATSFALVAPVSPTAGSGDDACFDRVLRRVRLGLAAAARTNDEEGREAIALAIVEDVTRFVLDWQEGT